MKKLEVVELRQSNQMAFLLSDTVGDINWAILKQEDDEVYNCLPSP